jgi:hypothetical protein
MQDIPIAQLLVLIAFILFPLLNLVLRRMQRRFEEQPPSEPPPQPAPRTYEMTPRLDVVASSREQARPPAVAEPPSRKSQSANRSLFGNRRELRRAIILMTVLGPCRAADSPTAEGRQFS